MWRLSLVSMPLHLIVSCYPPSFGWKTTWPTRKEVSLLSQLLLGFWFRVGFLFLFDYNRKTKLGPSLKSEDIGGIGFFFRTTIFIFFCSILIDPSIVGEDLLFLFLNAGHTKHGHMRHTHARKVVVVEWGCVQFYSPLILILSLSRS